VKLKKTGFVESKRQALVIAIEISALEEKAATLKVAVTDAEPATNSVAEVIRITYAD